MTGTVTAKGDRGMVTETDLAVERPLGTHLTASTPAIGFLGEEEGTAGASGELMWMLDPVEGTAGRTG